ncbi:hypothetical protein ALP99_100652 [Pseudomonas syringae pv. tomato]|nr:hypothetical protein ALP99_100652 [Pseudomonas syringae pv. tomato]
MDTSRPGPTNNIILRSNEALGGMATRGRTARWQWWAVCTSREPGRQKNEEPHPKVLRHMLIHPCWLHDFCYARGHSSFEISSSRASSLHACGQKAENTVFRFFQDLCVTLGASDSGARNCARPASRDKNARNMSD